MDHRVEKILLTTEEIQEGIVKAANWIDQNYANKELVLIGLLKGCLPFFGQMISHIKTDCLIDCMMVSSWEGKTNAISEPKIIQDVTENITNKHVLLVDEIIDSALTLKYVEEYLQKKYKPASIKMICLLDKPGGRKIDLNPAYSCFEVENKFVVGYGCDFEGKLRNLPYVGIFKQEKNK